MAKEHNEYFMSVSLGKRKSCPTCHAKHNPLVDDLWAWGEYAHVRWYTVMHFCKHCFVDQVIPALRQHAKQCGCTFNLVARSGYTLPTWLHM